MAHSTAQARSTARPITPTRLAAGTRGCFHRGTRNRSHVTNLNQVETFNAQLLTSLREIG